MSWWSTIKSYFAPKTTYTGGVPSTPTYGGGVSAPAPAPAPSTSTPATKTTYTPSKPSTPTYGGTTGYGYVEPAPSVSGPITPSYRPPPSPSIAPAPSAPTGYVSDIQEPEVTLKEKMVEVSKKHLGYQVEYDPEKGKIIAKPTPKLVREHIKREIEEAKKEHPYGTDFKYDPETKMITWKEQQLTKGQEVFAKVSERGREKYPSADPLWSMLDPRSTMHYDDSGLDLDTSLYLHLVGPPPGLEGLGLKDTRLYHIGSSLRQQLDPHIETAKTKAKDLPLGIGVGFLEEMEIKTSPYVGKAMKGGVGFLEEMEIKTSPYVGPMMKTGVRTAEQVKKAGEGFLEEMEIRTAPHVGRLMKEGLPRVDRDVILPIHTGAFLTKEWIQREGLPRIKKRKIPGVVGIGAITTTKVGVGTGLLAFPPVAVGVAGGALFLAGSEYLKEHPTTPQREYKTFAKPFDPVEKQIEEEWGIPERRWLDDKGGWVDAPTFPSEHHKKGTVGGGEVGLPGRYPGDIPTRHKKKIIKEYGFPDELPVKLPTEEGYVRKYPLTRDEKYGYGRSYKYPFKHSEGYGHDYPYGYPEEYGHGYPYEHPFKHPYQFPYKYPYEHPPEYGYPTEHLYKYEYPFKFPTSFKLLTLTWDKRRASRRAKGKPYDPWKVRWINPFASPEQVLGLKPKRTTKKGKRRATTPQFDPFTLMSTSKAKKLKKRPPTSVFDISSLVDVPKRTTRKRKHKKKGGGVPDWLRL